MNSRIIITGGPGAGKTTLITALEKSGFHCQPESGRAVIKQQMDINGDTLPWRSPARFAEAMQAMGILMPGIRPNSPIFPSSTTVRCRILLAISRWWANQYPTGYIVLLTNFAMPLTLLFSRHGKRYISRITNEHNRGRKRYGHMRQ